MCTNVWRQCSFGVNPTYGALLHSIISTVHSGHIQFTANACVLVHTCSAIIYRIQVLTQPKQTPELTIESMIQAILVSQNRKAINIYENVVKCMGLYASLSVACSGRQFGNRLGS